MSKSSKKNTQEGHPSDGFPAPRTSATGTGELFTPWETELENLGRLARDDSKVMNEIFHKLESSVEDDAHRSNWFEFSTSSRYILLFLLATLVALMVVVFKLRPDWADYSSFRMNLVIASYSAVIVLLVWALMRPLYKVELPTFLSYVVLPSVGLLLPLIVALSPGPYAMPTYTPASLAHFLKDTVVCLAIGMLLAAPFVYSLHRFARFQANFSFSFMTAAAGGLLAALTLQLLCHKESTSHNVFSHSTIGLLFLFVFALLHKRKSTKKQLASEDDPTP